MKKTITIIMLLFLVTSCTENSRARNWGGSETLELKDGELLQNMTWKGDDLWIQTIDTTTGVCYFRESSSWGVWEGQITIKSSTPIKAEEKSLIDDWKSENKLL